MEAQTPLDPRQFGLETRVRFLLLKARLEKVKLPEDTARYIAQNIWSSTKALESAFLRLVAYSTLTRKEMSVDQARKLLRDLVESKGTVDPFQGVSQERRGTNESTRHDGYFAANTSVVLNLVKFNQVQKVTRVRAQFEVNMRELERGRLARFDSRERWSEVQAAKRRRG